MIFDLENNKYLFLSKFFISNYKNILIKKQIPEIKVVMEADKEWEYRIVLFVSILPYEDGYIMYYKVHPGKDIGPSAFSGRTCVAFSKDGINWEKPNLHINQIRGSKENNIIHISSDHGCEEHSFFYDYNDNEYPYKCVRKEEFPHNPGLRLYGSKDGLTEWKKFGNVFPFHSDNSECIFWDHLKQEYKVYFRAFHIDHMYNNLLENHWGRALGIVQPKNIKELWPVLSDEYKGYPYGWSDDTKSHANVKAPSDNEVIIVLDPFDFSNIYNDYYHDNYYTYHDYYSANVFRIKNTQSLYGAMISEYCYGKQDAGQKKEYMKIQFAFSRNGINWRFPFKGEWYIDNYIIKDALGYDKIEQIFPAQGEPIFTDEYNLHYFIGYPEGHYELGLYDGTWFKSKGKVFALQYKKDRYASITNEHDADGYIKTNPFKCDGNKIKFNLKVNDNGYIKINILDYDNNTLEEYGIIINNPVDDIDFIWDKDFTPLIGKPIRLEVKLINAELFSFQMIKDN